MLTITFVGAHAYAYQGVPADVAEDLRLDVAKGDYFKSTIRDRFAAVAFPPSAKSAQRSLL